MASPRICKIEGCGKPHLARGWCYVHYQRWQRSGDPLKTRFYNGAECSVQGCNRPAETRNYCNRHYHRWLRHCDPLGGDKFRCPRGEPIRWLKDRSAHEGDECLIWPYARLDDDGYGPSREMCRLAHGEPPTPQHHAAHSCGKGHEGCVNPKHLRWATPLENAADMYVHGTILRGSSHPRSKLSEEDVRAIRSLIGKRSHVEIASMFGVSPMTIAAIKHRRVWAWLS